MIDLEKKLHLDREEINRFVDKHRNIYIYGKGYVAKHIKRYLDVEDVKVTGFLVTNGDDEPSCDGLPVFVASNLGFTDEDGIIIAVSEKSQREIATNLMKAGVEGEHIYGQKIICTHEGALINLSSKLKEYGDNNSNYFSSYVELNRIGLDVGTDKSSRWHNYLSKYEFFLCKYKNENINLLELGILDGNSLRMWKNYFDNAEIYGVDIDLDTKKNEEDRINVIVGDLDNVDFLKSLSNIKPTIIIEDASHSWSQQIIALCTLYEVLPSGGIYIVEDIETSFSSWKHRGYDNAIISGYEFCEAVAKVVTGGEFLNPRDESAAIMELKEEIYDIALKTVMISFIHGSCILIRN